MVVFQDVEKSCYTNELRRVVISESCEEMNGELKLRQNLDRVSLLLIN